MKPSNTSVAKSMRQEAKKLASYNPSAAAVDIATEEVLLHIQKLESTIAELELQNEKLRTNNPEDKTIEQQYSIISQHAPTAYLIVSETGEIVTANIKAAVLLEKEPSQLKNSNFSTFLAPVEDLRFRKLLQTLFNTNNTETTELSLKTSIPTIVTITAVFVVETKQCLLQITDNRKLRTEFDLLQQEREFIGDILDSQPAGIYRLRVFPMEKWKKDSWRNVEYPPYTMEFLNDHFCNILGVEHEVFKMHPGIISELIHPKDKAEFVRLNEDANQRITPFKWEGRVIVNDKIKWIHLESIPRIIEDGDILWTGLLYDITEAKQLEADLKLSEIKFKNVFNHSIVGKSLTTLNGQLNVNSAFIEMLGYSYEELKDKPWEDITFPDDIQHNADLLKRIISGEINSARFEKRFIHKNGSLVWVDLSTTLLRDENNNPLFYITEIIDITKRKNAQFALQDSNDRLSLILENSPIAIWDWDLETDKWFATQKYYSMLGYEPVDGYPERNLWLTRIHPDDRKQVQVKIENVLQRKAEAYAYDARMLHADGTYRWHSVLGQVIERAENGKPKRMLGVRIDINERKQIEDKLRESQENLTTLFASMTEMVAMHELVCDENGNAINYLITDCNAAFTTITGIERQNVVGKLGTEVYDTIVAPYLEQYAHVAMTGESKEFDSYFAPMDKHFLISAISPKKNKFATIATDVTTLQQIQQQVLAKSKELEDYLYITSHDLRSPLVNIQGFSQRLQKQTDKIKSQLENCEMDSMAKMELDKITAIEIPKTLDFIFSSIAKMETLINGLLQLSRTGRVKVSIDRIDMNKLIKTVLAAHNYQISELTANIIVEDLPECYGDEQQLNQLFSNLISNAIKYRNRDRIFELTIKAIYSFNRVIYSIADNGIGISPKFHQKIWNIFYRVHSQTQIFGDGMGLSIVKQIAERHHGKVWVESDEEQGSTFFIELQKNSWEQS
jgi:PAS domain S-box-containing protein